MDDLGKNYKKVKGYYDSGAWTAGMCRNAVGKGWITPAGYESITGLEY